MKTQRKRIITFLAAFALLMTALVSTQTMKVLAEDQVAVTAAAVTVNAATEEEFKAALQNAADGETIVLAAGEYTADTVNASAKNLTIVGAGSGKTKLCIRKNSTNSYGQDGAFSGCNSVTFQDLTIVSSQSDYWGYVGIDNTVVKNCEIIGFTTYWGGTSATFTDTVFNQTASNYALWDYCCKTMTFDSCTFNVAGKVVQAYHEGGGQTYTLNINNCTVNSSKANKSFVNIKDHNYYNVNFTGTNTVNGLNPNKKTCSRLYMVEYDNVLKKASCTATVKVNGTTVWEDTSAGTMTSENHKYGDGEAEDNYEYTTETVDGEEKQVRTCKYCGYSEYVVVETPEDPEEPEDPETPEDPEEPETPEEPGEDEDTLEPTLPIEVIVPVDPVPEIPADPETPADQETPAAPETPQTPAAPQAPVTAQNPAAPQDADAVEEAAPVAAEADDNTDVLLAEDNEIPTSAGDGAVSEETTTIEDSETAKAASDDKWALANLILEILTALEAIVLLITLFIKNEDDEKYEESEKDPDAEDKKTGAAVKKGGKKKAITRIIGVLIALVGAIVFLLTEHTSLPMAAVDQFTIVMAIVFVAETIVMVLSKSAKGQNDTENDEPEDSER